MSLFPLALIFFIAIFTVGKAENIYEELASTLRESGVLVYRSPSLGLSWKRELLTRLHEGYKYYKAVVVANAACSYSGVVGSAGGCPNLVVRPTSSEQVSKVVQLCTRHQVPISIRGGGHSYTCQGTKHGGVMIDTRALNSIRLVEQAEKDGERGEEGNENVSKVELGSGLLWGEVIRYLKPRNYSIVHGQCTSVGVAGFALHGGVHFGGLSEVFGLASDNILGLTLVDARGRIVSLTSTSCSIDGMSVASQEFQHEDYKVLDTNTNTSSIGSGASFQDCQDLWFAM